MTSLTSPPASERAKITALIPVHNCEENIRNCLESIQWVDEILVVDSYSTDSTLDICREYTDRIIQHEYVTSARQKNWAMEQVTTEWVLQIDSDEVADAGLGDEIMDLLPRASAAEGYWIPRKNLIWGRWMRQCRFYPDRQLRFFRAAKGRWTDREVHAHVGGLETTGTLHAHLIHYDLADLSKELQQFARQVVRWEANELIKRGKRWQWQDVTLRPLAIFLMYYLRLGGFREGFRGFYISIYRAFYSFMTYARLYEDEVRQGLKS